MTMLVLDNKNDEGKNDIKKVLFFGSVNGSAEATVLLYRLACLQIAINDRCVCVCMKYSLQQSLSRCELNKKDILW